MKRILPLAILAAAFCSATVPAPALAQMDNDNRRCVGKMHKVGLKASAARAKQIAACVSGAQDGSVTDLTACLAAPDAKVDATLVKGDEDAEKSCGYVSPEFGLPASFDDTIGEAALAHTEGLLADLLGGSPSVVAGDDGECQVAALKALQKFAGSYRKDFAKCVGKSIKDGALDGDALLPCLSPDLSADEEKLADKISKACAAVSPATVLPGSCSAEPALTVADCLTTRARCRLCRQAATSAAIDGDCDLVDDAADNDSCSFPVTLSGNAINFSNGSRLEGSSVWVLEHPEMMTITDADGYFEFTGLEEGEEVSLVLEDPAYHPIQNGTIRLGPNGASRVTFQAVNWATYDALAFILGVVPDELTKCQMVTTVTRLGKSIYDPGAHGEAFATVSTSPALPEENGPIYFNSDVIPQPSLTRTSDDGGALYIQVPPGEYVWTAHKANLIFTRIKSKCRAGLLVNASPPWGLQIH